MSVSNEALVLVKHVKFCSVCLYVNLRLTTTEELLVCITAHLMCLFLPSPVTAAQEISALVFLILLHSFYFSSLIFVTSFSRLTGLCLGILCAQCLSIFRISFRCYCKFKEFLKCMTEVLFLHLGSPQLRILSSLSISHLALKSYPCHSSSQHFLSVSQ